MQENIPQDYLPDDEESPDYVHAVPEVHYPQSINAAEELVDRHVDEGRGDNVAIYFEDQEITYAELQEKVNRLGNALRELGVEPGDRVLIRFPNRPESIISILAVQKIGGVALPSMKLLRAHELTYIINNAEAKTAIVYDDLLDEVEKAMPNLNTLEDIIAVERNDVDHDHHSYDALMSEHSTELDAYDSTRDDLALMLYTSGTTGQPKGATHTHRHVLAIADTYARYCLDPDENDVFGGNPPLPFAYGFGGLLAFPFRFGGSTSLIEDATPEDLLQAVEDHGVTILFSIPTAFNQILSQHPNGPERFDTSSLRLAVSAGEPLTPTTYENFKE
ncbi:MAG: acyl-CoA synthetase, partial [Halobacteria archaeon]|nr:acyl-CoA synthetase [Halobacteria archaeon]